LFQSLNGTVFPQNECDEDVTVREHKGANKKEWGIISTSKKPSWFSEVQVCCALLPVLVMAVVLSLPVSAHDPSKPRGGCPPVEEEIVDLQLLGDMLADSKAIGIFTKLGLKRDIEKVLSRLNKFHDGKSKFSLEQLQEQYDLLLMKIAIHLQDKDLALHKHLCNAWLVIWEDLRDFDRFHEHHG
jgi:hypothetical protein